MQDKLKNKIKQLKEDIKKFEDLGIILYLGIPEEKIYLEKKELLKQLESITQGN